MDEHRDGAVETSLERVDRALLRLRRMWDAPAGIEHEGALVEGSTLLVCLAVEEGLAGAAEVGVVEVAAALGVTHSTASRLVTRAVAAGMVARRPSSTDPRRTSLTPTAAGRRLVAASRAFRTARLAALLAGWPDRDVAALADLLTRFAAAAAGPRP
ncbi:MarR family winged helix-turn-helix transcriptional regulator [Geodermatophilus sp. TF02-6]|uniref:MarR family winged helix-turn-helix transcriptional regulator n=1 Tax=Geodermatophilus sp. TF02-6 TaxID=2250575 RepID=UPI0013149D36|nr:MarR family winged helix-turn-helix transcriptional regulator [Geodermatophilus sp. TF02-6]